MRSQVTLVILFRLSVVVVCIAKIEICSPEYVGKQYMLEADIKVLVTSFSC